MATTPLITVEQLGAQVKKKYPAYASRSDEEVGKAMLAKYPVYASKVFQPQQTATSPEARTTGNYLREALYGIGRGVRNDVSGIPQMVEHPLKTAKGISDQARTAEQEAVKEFEQTKAAPLYQRGAAAALTGLEQAPIIGGMVQHAEQGGMRVASPESVGAAMEGITTFAAPDLAVKGIAKLPGDVLRESARGALRNAAGISTEDIGEAAKRGTEEAQKHAEETQEAVNEQQRREDAEKNALRNKTEQVAKEQADTRRKVAAENRKAEQEHTAAVAKTREENAAAVREQAKIKPTQENLESATRELQAQIETARNNALKVGNEKYNAVNEKLNPLPADMETVQNATIDAAGKLKGSDKVPAVLKDITGKVEKGESLNYEDLQGYYSELGKEISKGTLQGDEYTALDTLHEQIGDEMQRIADSQGAGAQLLDARNYWRRMKQTFGKRYNPTDTGNTVLKNVAGRTARDAERDNQLRLLGSFDKTIPQTAEHIANLQKGLKTLPEEKPLRKVVKVPPAKPASTAAPRFEGTPEEMARQSVSQPERPEYPNKPEQIDLLQDRAQKVMEKGSSLKHSKTANFISHALTGFGSTWALVEVLRGELSYGAAVVGSRILIGAAQRGLGSLLENPAVAEWIARPSASDIEAFSKLTPQQKAVFANRLEPVLKQAQRRGIKVSPALIAFVGTGIAAATQPKKTPGDVLRQAQQ